MTLDEQFAAMNKAELDLAAIKVQAKVLAQRENDAVQLLQRAREKLIADSAKMYPELGALLRDEEPSRWAVEEAYLMGVSHASHQVK